MQHEPRIGIINPQAESDSSANHVDVALAPMLMNVFFRRVSNIRMIDACFDLPSRAFPQTVGDDFRVLFGKAVDDAVFVQVASDNPICHGLNRGFGIGRFGKDSIEQVRAMKRRGEVNRAFVVGGATVRQRW